MRICPDFVNGFFVRLTATRSFVFHVTRPRRKANGMSEEVGKPAVTEEAPEPNMMYIWRLNIMAEPAPGTVLTALEVVSGGKVLAEESFVLVESTSATNPMAATIIDDGKALKDPTAEFADMYRRLTGRKLLAVQARLFGHRPITPEDPAQAEA
jgi:hypothetical protein